MKLKNVVVGGEYGLNIAAHKRGVTVGTLADDTRYGQRKDTGAYEANPKGKTLVFLVNGEPTFVHVRNVMGTVAEAEAKFAEFVAEKDAKLAAKAAAAAEIEAELKAGRAAEWQAHAASSKEAALPDSLVKKLFEAAGKGATSVELALEDFR